MEPESRDGRFRAAALACRLIDSTDGSLPPISILVVCLFMGVPPLEIPLSNKEFFEYCSSVLVCLCACEASLSLYPRAEWPADR